MRRLIALAALMAAVQISAGCRHVGGACDCDHAGGRTNGGNCGCNAGPPSPSNPGVCGYYGGSYNISTSAATPVAPPPLPANLPR